MDYAGWAHANLAYAAQGLGRHPTTARHLGQALRAAVETGVSALLLWALPAAALLLADQDAAGSAVELYALSSQYGLVAKSGWFEHLAGRHIAAVTASLTEDTAAAAGKGTRQAACKPLWGNSSWSWNRWCDRRPAALNLTGARRA